MPKKYLLFSLSLIVMTVVFYSQDKQTLTVEEIEICESVKDHQPVNADTTFPANIGKLSCYTKIVGAEDSTQISHVWYYGNEEMAKVDLDVKLPSWRTWSTKTIIEDWTGEWEVRVVDANGNLLSRKAFVIESK